MATLAQRLADLIVAIGADIKALYSRVLPASGSVGQALVKSSATNYAVTWSTVVKPDGTTTAVGCLPVYKDTAGTILGPATPVAANSFSVTETGATYPYLKLVMPTSATRTSGIEGYHSATGAKFKAWVDPGQVNEMLGTSGMSFHDGVGNTNFPSVYNYVKAAGASSEATVKTEFLPAAGQYHTSFLLSSPNGAFNYIQSSDGTNTAASNFQTTFTSTGVSLYVSNGTSSGSSSLGQSVTTTTLYSNVALNVTASSTLSLSGSTVVQYSGANSLTFNGGLGFNGSYGTANQILTSQGTGVLPSWQTLKTVGGNSLLGSGDITLTASNGVPTGGAGGYCLVKTSATDYAMSWQLRVSPPPVANVNAGQSGSVYTRQLAMFGSGNGSTLVCEVDTTSAASLPKVQVDSSALKVTTDTSAPSGWVAEVTVSGRDGIGDTTNRAGLYSSATQLRSSISLNSGFFSSSANGASTVYAGTAAAASLMELTSSGSFMLLGVDASGTLILMGESGSSSPFLITNGTGSIGVGASGEFYLSNGTRPGVKGQAITSSGTGAPAKWNILNPQVTEVIAYAGNSASASRGGTFASVNTVVMSLSPGANASTRVSLLGLSNGSTASGIGSMRFSVVPGYLRYNPTYNAGGFRMRVVFMINSITDANVSLFFGVKTLSTAPTYTATPATVTLHAGLTKAVGEANFVASVKGSTTGTTQSFSASMNPTGSTKLYVLTLESRRVDDSGNPASTSSYVFTLEGYTSDPETPAVTETITVTPTDDLPSGSLLYPVIFLGSNSTTNYTIGVHRMTLESTDPST